MEYEYTIRVGTLQDLRSIAAWLKKEHNRSTLETGGSFWNNINLIEQAQAGGRLRALLIAGERRVSAFCLGTHRDYSMLDILEVRPECRGSGFGRAIAQRFIGEARRADSMGIWLKCQPRTSIPFWRHLGFVEIDSETAAHVLCLPKPLSPLPVGETKPLTISMRDGAPEDSAFSTIATLIGDRVVLRDEYVRHIHDSDTMVEVRLGDEVIHDYKVKYLRDLGAQHSEGFTRVRELVMPGRSKAV